MQLLCKFENRCLIKKVLSVNVNKSTSKSTETLISHCYKEFLLEFTSVTMNSKFKNRK